MSKVLKITQTKSESKLTPSQLKTLKAVGLRGRGRTVFRKDLRAIRGMLNKVQHMVEAELLDGQQEASPAKSTNKGYKIG